jgi:hypothetical protein
MTDFSKPVATDAYATLLPALVTELQDLARGLDPVATGSHTNIPTNTIRWNAANTYWEKYNGTSWAALAATYAIGISGNAATVTNGVYTSTIASLAPSLTGSGATGTWGINITGNAATATSATSATSAGSATTATTASNVSGLVAVANGGTGATSLAANNVLLGNGSSALQVVAPSTAGNVLTSNGSTWSSAAPSNAVSSVNGVTGAVVTTGLYAIGSFVIGRPANMTNYPGGSTVAGSALYSTLYGANYTASGWNVAGWVEFINTGSWRCVSIAYGDGSSLGNPGLWVRYA